MPILSLFLSQCWISSRVAMHACIIRGGEIKRSKRKRGEKREKRRLDQSWLDWMNMTATRTSNIVRWWSPFSLSLSLFSHFPLVELILIHNANLYCLLSHRCGSSSPHSMVLHPQFSVLLIQSSGGISNNNSSGRKVEKRCAKMHTVTEHEPHRVLGPEVVRVSVCSPHLTCCQQNLQLKSENASKREERRQEEGSNGRD